MPTSLPVPSKSALRALRHLAWGTSCTIAFSTAVLTEDRRRRIRAAQEVRGNARKLKLSKQYHNSGTVVLESFEEEFGLTDDFTWGTYVGQDEKQVSGRDSSSALSTSTADLNFPIPSPNPFPISELPGRLRNLKESIRQPPILPAKSTAPTIITKIPSVKQTANRFQRTFRANRLAYDIRTILQDGEDPEAVDAAASRFFDAFAEEVTFPLTQPLIEILVKLSSICWYRSKEQVSGEILDVVLAHGPIQEEDFYLFHPAGIIKKLWTFGGASMPPSGIDTTKLKKAITLFLTKFKDKPKSGHMPKEMSSVGKKLCGEACRFEMYHEAKAIYSRLKASCGKASLLSQKYFIMATHAQGHHMQTVQQFQKFYTLSVEEASSHVDQLMLYDVVGIAIESALKIYAYDKAEETLYAAAKIAEHNEILISTTWPLKIIGHLWRSTKDIARARRLFDSFECHFNLTKHPRALYAAIIQFCIEANDEVAAMSYHEKLLKEYPADTPDWRIHGHFALAEAMRKDWTGVEERFSQIQKLKPNVTEYGRIFTPILKIFSQSYSIGEVEDFIRLFIDKYHVPLTSFTSGLMINAYGKAHEVDSLSRWIKYIASTSIQPDPNIFNTILHKCYESWKFNFEESYQLYKSAQKLQSSSSFINDGTISILRCIAFAEAGPNPTVAWSKLAAIGLESSIKSFPTDSRAVQEKMALEIAQGRPAKALAIYWKASRRNIPLHSQVVVTAVKASLQCHGSDFGATIDLLENAGKCQQDTGDALSVILAHRIAELGKDTRVQEGEIVAMARATVLSLEERNIVITNAAATQTASILVKRGRYREAIDVWVSMSRSRGFTSTSIDIVSLDVLLRAYINLRDCAGIQWVIRMISENGLFPDRPFYLLLKDGRRQALQSIGSGPDAQRYHKLLCAAVKRVVKMRASAIDEKEDVKTKVLSIMETASETQKERIKKGSAMAKPKFCIVNGTND